MTFTLATAKKDAANIKSPSALCLVKKRRSMFAGEIGGHLRLCEEKGGRILSRKGFEIMNEVGLIVIAARERNVAPAVRVFLQRFKNFLKANDARKQFWAESDSDLKSAFELARAQS